MKKKQLKQLYKQTLIDSVQYRNALRHYQNQYYNALDQIDELEKEIDESWGKGYESGHNSATELIQYSRRRRVWYKLWL